MNKRNDNVIENYVESLGMVGLSIVEIKSWAYGLYVEGLEKQEILYVA